MVSQINQRTNTNNYIENTPATTKQGKKPLNSVMTQNQAQQASDSTKDTSSRAVAKLDELLEKLCEKLEKLGISTDELKKNEVLQGITGLTEDAIKKLPEEKIKKIFEALEVALADSVVNGKVDFDKAKELGKKYLIALGTGWTIDGFKNAKQESLSQKMERYFGIKNFSSLPQKEIQKYVRRYFHDTFDIPLENARTQKEKEEIIKKQLQDFGKMLAHTPDEEKAIFKEAIHSLVAKHRARGLKTVFESFGTPRARRRFANNWTPEDTKRLATEADTEGNVPSESDVRGSVASIFKEKDAENIKADQDILDKEAKEFFEKNKDKLAKIDEKIATAKANNVEPNLTEEEKLLLRLRDNYFKSAKAGEILGTAINIDISIKDRNALLSEMNNDLFELPIYKGVLSSIDETIKLSPDILKDSNEYEINKILNNATNGNYNNVISNSEKPLNPPVQNNSEINNVQQEGFAQSVSQNVMQDSLVRKNELQQSVQNSSIEKTQFTIEKDEQSAIITKNPSNINLRNVTSKDLNKFIANGGNKTKLFQYCCKKYNDASKSMQQFVQNEFKSLGNSYKEIYLNTKLKFSGSDLMSFLRETRTDVASINLQNIDADFNTKQELKKKQQEEANA